MRVSWRLRNADEAIKKFANLRKAVEPASKLATRKAAEEVFAVTQERVPVATGLLKSTGQIESVRGGPHRYGFTIGYGSGDAFYAIYVHERLDVHHPHGEAKFIERPVLEYSSRYGHTLAGPIRSALERGR